MVAKSCAAIAHRLGMVRRLRQGVFTQIAMQLFRRLFMELFMQLCMQRGWHVAHHDDLAAPLARAAAAPRAARAPTAACIRLPA
jgi:hypothetical protein